jgi:hypothetical protein
MLVSLNAIWEYQSRAFLASGFDPTTTPPPASGWTGGGVAPFGNTSARGTQPKTTWASNTGLWIRRNFVTDGVRDVYLESYVDNRAYVYVNGSFFGKFENGGFDFALVIPRSLLPAGTNTIAILAMDDGLDTFLSATLEYLAPLIALQPQSPVTESVAWLTDISTSENGLEDRIKLRNQPRQYFTFFYPANNGEQRRVFNQVYGQRGSEWLVPIWTEARFIGSVGAGATTIPGSVADYDFRLGELAILWQSSSEFQVINIVAFASGSVVTNTPAAAFTNAYIMPLRFGFIRDNPSKQFSGRESLFGVKFEIQTNFAPIVISAPTQFLGEDLSTEEVFLTGTTSSDSLVTEMDLNDKELGVVSYYAPWLNTKVMRTVYRDASTPAQALQLRRWLYRREGKYRAFWQPSFEDDLRVLSTGTITTTLIVSSDEYLATNQVRKRIAIQTATGWTLATIASSVQLDANRVQHTLTTSLAIAANSILRVCWLGLKRLNSDQIEFDWEGQGYLKVTLPILEITP